jgi:subtilase family serine protease
VTLTPTDTYALKPGHQWNNIQSVVHLNNWANFVPGTPQWYSTCLVGTSFATDPHFAVYYKGNLVFSSGINAPACAAPHGRQKLSGHISPAMKAAPLVRPVPNSTVISLAIGLPIALPSDGSQSIDDFIKDVSDPKSPNYGNYLDVKGYTAKYGSPSTNAVGEWAKSHGLAVIKTFPNMVRVSGSAAAIAQALYLNMNYYTRPDGTQFYAPDREPSLDFDPTVDHISRLDDLFVSRPLNGSGFNDLCGQGNPDCNVSHLEGTNAYLGRDLRNAYASCHLSLTGAQQAVGLVGNGFSIADLNAYSQADLGKPTNANQITAVITEPAYPVCGFPAVTCGDGSRCRPDPACSGLGLGACCPKDDPARMTTCDVACDVALTGCQSTGSGCPYPSDGETPLDMAMVLGMAPDATIVMFEGWHDSTMLQAMANYTDMRINQFSSSFSVPLDDNITKALKQMAAQGQSFFQSSGDSGAIADPGDIRSSDLLTTVGGTNLMMTGNGDSWSSESVWGLGGGFYTDGNSHITSPGIAKPHYQQFIDMTANNRGGDNRYRSVPDVAAVASNTEYFWGTRSAQNTGGTSVSAPVWAGFMALANEQRSQRGMKSSVGFANPLLYSLAQSDSTYMLGFNDITVGRTGRTRCDPNYTFCFPYDPAGGFQAEPGYDLATGLGSPQCHLIDLLQGSIPRHVTVTANAELRTCDCPTICGNSSGGTIEHPSAAGSCDLNAANPTCTIDFTNYQLCAGDLGLFVRATLTLQNDDSVTVCPQDWWADGDNCGRDNWKWSGSSPCTTVAANANVAIDTSGMWSHDDGSCNGGLCDCPTHAHIGIMVFNADAQ